MVIFNVLGYDDPGRDVVRFHSKYTSRNYITDQTVRNLNEFIKSSFNVSEVKNIVSNVDMLTSVIRMLLVESIYYNTKGKNEAGKLNAITRQEGIDIPNYIQSFIHSTNLREKIASFITSRTKAKSVVFLETLFLIILNHILCIVFNNAVQDIKTTMEIDVDPFEYNRLIFRFYRKYHRDGWLNIIKHYLGADISINLETVLHSAFTNSLINIPFKHMFDPKGFDICLNDYLPFVESKLAA